MSDNFEFTKKLLDSVSSCFCIAKWSGVSLHLETGTTHSCHHPAVHKIPIEELKNNPSALHNTQFKIEQRKKMMAGERPAECDYCWRIEDLQSKEISDRVLKSSSNWSLPVLGEIVTDPLSSKFKPRYVEVSFSNKCQFKCSYCSANYSSSWAEELVKFGNYETGSGWKDSDVLEEETNPYVKAFWEWWPELKTGLNTFRITGGEPLLSPSTFRVLESLLENPEPNLNIAINSNLGAPPVLIQKFNDYVYQIMEKKAVGSFELYTSIDTFGSQAEYIRNGLKHDYFWNNVDQFLDKNQNCKITFMCTFNAFSLFSFIPLLQKIMELNLKHRSDDRKLPIYIDIAFLRYPDYQTVQILPETFIPYMEKIVNFIDENQWYKTPNNVGFHDTQFIKSKRILEWMRQGLEPTKKTAMQKRFYQFFKEHDRRRNTDLVATFPELEQFWESCKAIP